jgi:hypothetical protein
VGDFDLNGVRNASDIPAMFAALTDLNHYQAVNQLDAAALLAVGDVNADGHVNNADMQALLTLLQAGGGTIAAVPEPGTLSLVGVAVAGLLCIVAGPHVRPSWRPEATPIPGRFLS